MFYRLFDRQCARYMVTGYNATSLEELIEDYKSYKSVDTEFIEEMSVVDYIDYIRQDEFVIENSETKFEEYDG